ncbi:MAG TPA: hypothetical protein VLI92_02085 [Candidatus Saccharimonadales bacterium]|nr:hypothetical protein [Candidatus Saccharimonadales bacterium]
MIKRSFAFGGVICGALMLLGQPALGIIFGLCAAAGSHILQHATRKHNSSPKDVHIQRYQLLLLAGLNQENAERIATIWD